MSLILYILLLLIGLGAGWLLRGNRVQTELQDLDARWRRRLSEVEGDRDRFAAELNQATEGRARLESSGLGAAPAEAEAETGGVAQLQADLAQARQHAQGLEQELSKARQAHADCRAASARLQARLDAIEPAGPASTGGAQAEPTGSSTAEAAAPAPSGEPGGALGLTGSSTDFASRSSAPGALAEAPAAAVYEPTAAPAAAAPLAGEKPAALASAEGTPDDLKLISGIGPKIERTLHDLGIFHFWQIAQFTRDNVAWVDQYLSFRGRIDREGWIEQAKILAAGGTIEPGRHYGTQ